MRYLCAGVFFLLVVFGSMSAKKEIEIKFNVEQKDFNDFCSWLKTYARDGGVEEHEEVYLNNPKKSFFFDHEQGYRDCHTTLRLRSKVITHKNSDTVERKDFFCSKFCHVDEYNRIVSRDEFEVALNDLDARKQIVAWFADKGYQLDEGAFELTKKSIECVLKSLGFSEAFELKKKRKLYYIDDLEIALDDLEGIGTFIEIELKSDEQDVMIGTKKIHDFLRSVGITQFIQYDRSYLHMTVNPSYNFGRQLSIQK